MHIAAVPRPFLHRELGSSILPQDRFGARHPTEHLLGVFRAMACLQGFKYPVVNLPGLTRKPLQCPWHVRNLRVRKWPLWVRKHSRLECWRCRCTPYSYDMNIYFGISRGFSDMRDSQLHVAHSILNPRQPDIRRYQSSQSREILACCHMARNRKVAKRRLRDIKRSASGNKPPWACKPELYKLGAVDPQPLKQAREIKNRACCNSDLVKPPIVRTDSPEPCPNPEGSDCEESPWPSFIQPWVHCSRTLGLGFRMPGLYKIRLFHSCLYRT